MFDLYFHHHLHYSLPTVYQASVTLIFPTTQPKTFLWLPLRPMTFGTKPQGAVTRLWLARLISNHQNATKSGLWAHRLAYNILELVRTEFISQLVGGIALVLLIVVGVTVGVVVSKNKKHNTGLSSNGSGSGAGTPNNPVNQTNPNDPSTFQKDPRLHRSFYGIAYEPEGSLLPDCGNSLGRYTWFPRTLPLLTPHTAQVITDIQVRFAPFPPFFRLLTNLL